MARPTKGRWFETGRTWAAPELARKALSASIVLRAAPRARPARIENDAFLESFIWGKNA